MKDRGSQTAFDLWSSGGGAIEEAVAKDKELAGWWDEMVNGAGRGGREEGGGREL